MPKIGVIVLAGTENPSDLGRVVNALETAKEFAAAGDEVALIFDGAGTQSIEKLSDDGHRYHGLYSSVKETTVTRVCGG